MITYRMVTESIPLCDVGQHTGFGVCAYRVEPAREATITHISDIFLSTEAAEHFVALCNRLQLDVLHLREAIDDVVLECI